MPLLMQLTQLALLERMTLCIFQSEKIDELVKPGIAATLATRSPISRACSMRKLLRSAFTTFSSQAHARPRGVQSSMLTARVSMQKKLHALVAPGANGDVPPVVCSGRFACGFNAMFPLILKVPLMKALVHQRQSANPWLWHNKVLSGGHSSADVSKV